MMPLTRKLLTLCALTLACRDPGPAPGPAAVLISGPPTCAACQIQVMELVTLSPPPEGFAEWPQSAWVDGRGRILIAQPNKRVPPAVFDSTGRFLQYIGREGDGPGEYRLAAHIASDASDTIWIADWGNRRLSVVSPELEFVRSFTTPRVYSLSPTGSGRLVAAASSIAGQATLTAVQLYDLAGNWLEGYGPVSGPLSGATDVQYLVARSRDGGFWAMRMFGRLLVLHVDREGRERWFERTPEWYVGLPEGSTDPTGASWGRTIWEDDAGLIWVVFQVPSLEPGLAMDTVRSGGEVAEVPRDIDAARDMWVEVLDPARGRLVASQRLPDVLSVGAGPGRMLRVVETDDGPRITVVQLSLQQER